MTTRLSGTIKKINKGRVHTHIHVLWKETPLNVIVTRASCDDMKLSEGDKILVFMKGTDVMLAKSFSGMLSARNRIDGVVRKIVRGDVLSKIMLESQGDTLQAIITNTSLNEMDIRQDDHVTAIVKSTELILLKGEEEPSVNEEGHRC